MLEVMAYLEGLAGPPDEVQLAHWSKAVGKPMHQLTLEDIQAAELQATVEWMTTTNQLLKQGGAKAAKGINPQTRIYLSELRKEARKKYAK